MIRYSKTLYKIDADGDIRINRLTAEDDKFIIESGKINTTYRVYTNKLSSYEQAKKAVDSLVKSKLASGGYYYSAEEAFTNDTTPMLALDYRNYEDKIDWENCFVQPKLDGIRCIKKHITKSTIFSRTNKVFKTVPHIEKVLKGLNIPLDGELYAHGEDFDTNSSLIKKFTLESEKKVKYWVYDTPIQKTFFDRFTYLKSSYKFFSPEVKEFIKLVPTHKVHNMREVKKYHNLFLSLGYEGTIIRQGNSTYKFSTRSNQLLKYKDFLDITCKIIDITPAKVKTNWGRPVVEWVNSEGKLVTFACSTKMSHKSREDLLTNREQYIGKTAEVRYFHETSHGIPRFPVMVGIRLDK